MVRRRARGGKGSLCPPSRGTSRAHLPPGGCGRGPRPTSETPPSELRAWEGTDTVLWGVAHRTTPWALGHTTTDPQATPGRHLPGGPTARHSGDTLSTGRERTSEYAGDSKRQSPAVPPLPALRGGYTVDMRHRGECESQSACMAQRCYSQSACMAHRCGSQSASIAHRCESQSACMAHSNESQSACMTQRCYSQSACMALSSESQSACMAHRCASQSACMAFRCESQRACMAHRCESRSTYVCCRVLSRHLEVSPPSFLAYRMSERCTSTLGSLLACHAATLPRWGDPDLWRGAPLPHDGFPQQSRFFRPSCVVHRGELQSACMAHRFESQGSCMAHNGAQTRVTKRLHDAPMRVIERLHDTQMRVTGRPHGAQLQVTECLRGAQMGVTERLRSAQV